MDKPEAGGNVTKKKTTVILKGEERSEMSRSKAFLMGLTKNSIPKEKDKRFNEMVSFVFNR